MNIFKIVLLLATLWAFRSSAMEIERPTVIAMMNEEFFYDIYPGYSTEENSDKSLKVMTLGISEFYLVDAHNQIIKTCKTNHQRILHAFYDKSGKYIITTATDQVVDIYDAECNKVSSLTDNTDGIHMGIFGLRDGKLVVITNSKSNNRLSKVWQVPAIVQPAHL